MVINSDPLRGQTPNIIKKKKKKTTGPGLEAGERWGQWGQRSFLPHSSPYLHMSPLLFAMRMESLQPAGLLSQICELWVSLSLLSPDFNSVSSLGGKEGWCGGLLVWGRGRGFVTSWWCQGSVSHDGTLGLLLDGGQCPYLACLLGAFVLLVGRICCLTSLCGLFQILQTVSGTSHHN